MIRSASNLAQSIGRTLRNSKLCGRLEYSRRYEGKEINLAIAARSALLQGVTEVAEAVKVAIGPKRRNVIIEKSNGKPKITKEGVTVTKRISFNDKAKNLGADLVKQVENATNKVAGDAIYVDIMKAGIIDPLKVVRGSERLITLGDHRGRSHRSP